MRLRQGGDAAAVRPGAAQQHAAPPDAPHSAAAGSQAARLKAGGAALAGRQREPAQAQGAAPVDPQDAAGDPAQSGHLAWRRRRQRVKGHPTGSRRIQTENLKDSENNAVMKAVSERITLQTQHI